MTVDEVAHIVACALTDGDYPTVEAAKVIDGPGHPAIAVAMDDGDRFFLTVERA